MLEIKTKRRQAGIEDMDIKYAGFSTSLPPVANTLTTPLAKQMVTPSLATSPRVTIWRHHLCLHLHPLRHHAASILTNPSMPLILLPRARRHSKKHPRHKKSLRITHPTSSSKHKIADRQGSRVFPGIRGSLWTVTMLLLMTLGLDRE